MSDFMTLQIIWDHGGHALLVQSLRHPEFNFEPKAAADCTGNDEKNDP